jgi:hypothetical protein
MAAKPPITAAAEAHTQSYIAVLLSPTLTTLSRAAKMASHYHPTTTSFIDGTMIPVPDPALLTTLIASTLEKIETEEGMLLVEKEHKVQEVGEGSAIVWITFQRKTIVWTNVYFFRRKEDGEVGWEGGIFDGEARMLRELAEEK